MSALTVAAITTILALLTMILGAVTNRELERILAQAGVKERPKRALHVILGVLVFIGAGLDWILLAGHP
ncbi:conserved protein of unknown function [Candidatus Hydrogenisulfobacillus filiaventi]|uniref:Uncharacterized protein n=1 Tax=Candidatus Hydrogenisulfobacillus filiaventi TaxID=2707344 RepID=A0A6F8ZJW9_9FIRM|nr:hypothetical protein [Bacillota bacterium]CAB1130027.1 conserved protein of unknown function [Candidatus Hydrogenisulfobacillus filiaventi]